MNIHFKSPTAGYAEIFDRMEAEKMLAQWNAELSKNFGFAKGEYKKTKDDSFELINVRITNAVRCVPPQNQVTSEELKNCRIK